MGTIAYAAYNSPKTYADKKAEIIRICENSGKNVVEQISCVGNIWYVAIKEIATGVVFAAVFKTETYKGEWSYKDMHEEMFPYYVDAPWSLLRKLTPTNHPRALEWRRHCMENIERKKEASKFVPKNGQKYDVSGLFGKYNGVELKTMTCLDHEKRRFRCGETGTEFRFTKKQVASLEGRDITS